MYEIIFAIFLAYLGTRRALPHSIRKLRENNYLAKDMYKKDTPSIPTNGGIIILFVSYITISLMPLISRVINRLGLLDYTFSDYTEVSLALVLVVSIYGLYGLVDDLVDIGRWSKLFLPVIFGLPLISVIYPEEFWFPFFGNISLKKEILFGLYREDLFKILIIPMYVMVVSNLVNMHSGYNGLQTGLSIILISTLITKSIMDNEYDNILPAGAFLGSLIAFYSYNSFPSKVFEGNIGSLTTGSLIGSLIVIQEFWWFGFFILIPHTLNFVLWILWLYLMKKDPEKFTTADGKHRKFGRVTDEGFLKVPNYLTLKWIPNYFYNINEKDSTKVSFCITFLFCSSGLLLSWLGFL